jgi:hypothetical protein
MRKFAVLLFVMALLVAACSSADDASTTTAGEQYVIPVDVPELLNTFEFNGTTCDLDDSFQGTITGEEIGGSGTLTITLEETGESSGHIVIAGVAEVQVDEPVTSVANPGSIALEIVSDSVNVLLVYGEWPACSS